MSLPCDNNFLLAPSSRSPVKVKYQSHSFGKNGRCWDIGVSQTHLVRLDLETEREHISKYPKYVEISTNTPLCIWQ